MMQRQHVDQRAEADAPGALGERRQEHARARHRAERRRMVLGEVIAVEAFRLKQLDKLQALLELDGARRAVVVEMIENAEREHADPVTARPAAVNYAVPRRAGKAP